MPTPNDHEEVIELAWLPDQSERCVVCGKPSNGKAVCDDDRCLQELAQG